MTVGCQQWLFFATQDLAFARSGLKEGFYAHVCYLAQQTVEKAMKGYLVAEGKEYPKTHGLITLHRLMGVDWLDAHLGSIKKLSEFYGPFRYPDTCPGPLPEGLPDIEDAANAAQWATAILTLIESHIEKMLPT